MIWNTDGDRKSLWPLWHSPLEVAELYHAAVHMPEDSHTRNAYETFWRETENQYIETRTIYLWE